MNYLLFINFNSGLKHNNVYYSLNHVLESIEQLAQDEKLTIENENIPTLNLLKKHLDKFDDYFGKLSNGTWYHIQPKKFHK